MRHTFVFQSTLHLLAEELLQAFIAPLPQAESAPLPTHKCRPLPRHTAVCKRPALLLSVGILHGSTH